MQRSSCCRFLLHLLPELYGRVKSLSRAFFHMSRRLLCDSKKLTAVQVVPEMRTVEHMEKSLLPLYNFNNRASWTIFNPTVVSFQQSKNQTEIVSMWDLQTFLYQQRRQCRRHKLRQFNISLAFFQITAHSTIALKRRTLLFLLL